MGQGDTGCQHQAGVMPERDCRPKCREARHETSPPKFFASGRGRCRAAGGLADREGASLSVADSRVHFRPLMRLRKFPNLSHAAFRCDTWRFRFVLPSHHAAALWRGRKPILVVVAAPPARKSLQIVPGLIARLSVSRVLARSDCLPSAAGEACLCDPLSLAMGCPMDTP